VAAARNAFDMRRWLNIPAPQRSQIIWRIAELIDANLERMARLESLNQRMPLQSAR
jgi:acyl-CoA reductase-like NAD-dependent aldehyde dehydrogenase